MDSIVEFEAKQHAMEQKHSRARHAWRHLADNLSKDDIKKFLGVRWEDIYRGLSSFLKLGGQVQGVSVQNDKFKIMITVGLSYIRKHSW